MATTKQARLSAADLAEQYGYVSALLNSNRELRLLFAKAYGTAKTGQWTARKFQAAIQNSVWYKTHSDQWRKVEAIRLGDPATYKVSSEAAAADAKRMAASMGAKITDAQALALGKVFYQSGYTQAQQQEALGAYIDETAPESGGVVGQALKSLKEYGGNMGVHKDDTWYRAAAKSVATGLSTVDEWMGDIQTTAKSLYLPFADRIDQGATVRDMASSYVNQMAQTLEIDPNSLDLQDPTIQKALKGQVDQKTGVPSVQPLWAFDQGLKQDPRWATTKNANQTANDTAMNVLQAMGFQG